MYLKPKIIVVAGAHSNVGKTTLCLKLKKLFSDSAVIKLGHGKPKKNVGNIFYPSSTDFKEIQRKFSAVQYLIVESNAVLEHINPELVIFLDGDKPKASAKKARERADILSGKRVDKSILQKISLQLQVPESLLTRVAWLAGARPEPVSAIILAGGQSRRMGEDKTKMQIAGTTMLQHIYEQLNICFDAVIVGTNKPKNEFNHLDNAVFIPDQQKSQGPLMGLFSTLQASGTRLNFVTGCDIPIMNMFAVRELLTSTMDNDIALASFKRGMVEPLYAVYNKKVANKAEKLLITGHRRIADLFPLFATEITEFTNSSWYHNINTRKDFMNYLGDHERA
ncbi:MAG: molybdenum cofactor guanylyltransferase [Fibrobacteria bacterium]|nr:molybdenum cofactor guanylyltransferase [Fibrobacteria bacterium]